MRPPRVTFRTLLQPCIHKSSGLAVLWGCCFFGVFLVVLLKCLLRESRFYDPHRLRCAFWFVFWVLKGLPLDHLNLWQETEPSCVNSLASGHLNLEKQIFEQNL